MQPESIHQSYNDLTKTIQLLKYNMYSYNSTRKTRTLNLHSYRNQLWISINAWETVSTTFNKI